MVTIYLSHSFGVLRSTQEYFNYIRNLQKIMHARFKFCVEHTLISVRRVTYMSELHDLTFSRIPLRITVEH